MDLVEEIMLLQQKLTTSIRALANNGKALAQAEMDYKICLRQHALRLRDEGTPVTLINQVIYGIPEVADKRFKRDVAETMRDVAQENINAIKLQLRLLNDQYTKEWGNER